MFPYRFMRPSTFLYRGPIPALEFFLDRDMNEDRAEAVKAFHSEFAASGAEWDAGEQVLNYLRSDVHLLRGGVVGILKEVFDFQEGLDNTTSLPFHAFSDAVTGPALAHKLFRFFGLKSDRQVFLTENSNNHRKTSTSEMQFCSYLQWKLNVPLRTAYTHPQGQLRVGGRFYADAVLESERIIFDFNGCLFHGHVTINPKCPLSTDLTQYDNTPYGETLRDAYHRWRLRKQKLELEGWRVFVMWECDWVAMKEAAARHRDLHTFLNLFYRSRPLDRLSPRRAMRGGRCESKRSRNALLFVRIVWIMFKPASTDRFSTVFRCRLVSRLLHAIHRRQQLVSLHRHSGHLASRRQTPCAHRQNVGGRGV